MQWETFSSLKKSPCLSPEATVPSKNKPSKLNFNGGTNRESHLKLYKASALPALLYLSFTNTCVRLLPHPDYLRNMAQQHDGIHSRGPTSVFKWTSYFWQIIRGGGRKVTFLLLFFLSPVSHFSWWDIYICVQSVQDPHAVETEGCQQAGMHAGCTSFSSTAVLNVCGRCEWMENPRERRLCGWMFCTPCLGETHSARARLCCVQSKKSDLGLACSGCQPRTFCSVCSMAASHRLEKMTQWELGLNFSHISTNDAKIGLFVIIYYSFGSWLLH